MKIDINKKYRTRIGTEVRLFTDQLGGNYCILGMHRACTNFWAQGSWTDEGKWQMESDEHDMDLIEIGQYDHIKVDDKVWAWMEYDEKRYPRHFAGVSPQGKPLAFDAGKTSWSSSGHEHDIATWDFCELYIGEQS